MKLIKNEKGQSMVETALVLPLVILLLLGIFDFGWLFYNKLQVENCVREGARYAAVSYDVKDVEACKTDITKYINENLKPNNLNFATTITDEKHLDSGYVTVKINTDVQTLTPITGIFFPGGMCHMEVSCTMHREKPEK